MKNEITLIIGASGKVGAEVVKQLKQQGHLVRKATSQPTKDADSVQINLASGEGIHQAFDGVSKAFLMAPPPYANQYKILSPLIQEAKRRGLKKVVLMTAWGANAVESAPFRQAEIELEKSGLTYVIIRPNWFMQNFNTFWVQGIKEQSNILVPAGLGKTSFIHSNDISTVVTKLLTTDKFDNRALDLSGPESLDHNQVAGVLSEVVGRKIGYVDVAPADMKKGLLGAGLPEDYTDFLLLIFGFLKEGYNAGINTNVQDIIGRKPLSFKEYVLENKKAFA